MLPSSKELQFIPQQDQSNDSNAQRLDQSSNDVSVHQRTAFVVIGLAGSGKSTFTKYLDQFIQKQGNTSFLMNIDPAVPTLPYSPNYDIRSQVNYKSLMRDHCLGPNGSLITSLNIFCATINDVLKFKDQNMGVDKNIIIDTPGQIEAFTWGASGYVMTHTLKQTYSSVILYVLDLMRCQNVTTFLSSMVTCCSVYLRLKVPMIVVLNKSDMADCSNVMKWILDKDELTKEINKQEQSNLLKLNLSIAKNMSEFFAEIKVVPVSSTQQSTGFSELIALINKEEIFHKKSIEENKQEQEEDEKKNIKYQEEISKCYTDYLSTQEANKHKKKQQNFSVSMSYGGVGYNQSQLKKTLTHSKGQDDVKQSEEEAVVAAQKLNK